MFLGRLNIEQKKAFLALAFKMVAADGYLDDKERQFIENYRYEMGLFNETGLPEGTVEELGGYFDSPESRKIVMMESLALAYVDGECCENERKILRALALALGVEEKDATELENWVLRHRDLIMRAELIIGGE